MQKSIYTVLLLCAPAVMAAQDNLEYNLKKYQLPAQSVLDSRRWHNLDVENSQVYNARYMGSLVNFMAEVGDTCAFSYLRRCNRNILSVSVDNANNSGIYLHYDGKRRTFGNILAGGELHIKGRGTLYGMASYSNGSTTGSSLNYVAHPENAAPYFVSDTLGCRTMHRETYTVSGGFSFRCGGFDLGTDASYEGVALSSTHDPKLANYSHYIRLGAGISRLFGRNILALRLTPEWSRESVSASSILDGVKYFQFYGFGLWNRRESQGAIGYGRQQTMLGVGADLSWMHDGAWHWTLAAGWRHRKVDTEETSFKQLFGSSTTHLYQQLMVSRSFDGSSLHLQLSADEHLRKGDEAVYQQQVQDADAGLYDYVKVGSNQLYSNKWLAVDFRAKYILQITESSSAAILGGVTYRGFEEKYDSPLMKVENKTTEVHIAAEYRTVAGRCKLGTDIHASVQGASDNNYMVPGNADKTQLTMAYNPYLMRGENHQSIGAALRMSVPLKAERSIGTYIAADYLNSDYRRSILMRAGLFYTF